jgi:predicted nucleotide-binding protein
MTPDDMGYTATEGPAAAQPRARQSVVLEVGMLLSAFGRTNVAMLKRGPVDVPSDAQGIIYLAFEKHVKEVVPRLVARLREAGFDLDPDNIHGCVKLVPSSHTQSSLNCAQGFVDDFG